MAPELMVGFKRFRTTSVLGGALALLAHANTALAETDEDAVQACAQAYEQAQVSRNAGKLKQAQEKLRVCVRDACPDFVRADCGQWLSEVSTEIPSVIFAAVGPKGNDLIDVKVSVDGELTTESLDGRALELDPGLHQIVFEYDGTRVEQRLVVRQGEKNRLVRVEIVSEVDSDGDGVLDAHDECPNEIGVAEHRGCPAPLVSLEPTSGSPNTLRWGAYAGWGVGAAGLATFGIFGAMGASAETKANDECPGRDVCTEEREKELIDGIESKFLVANIGLGVGIAGAIAGTVLFFLSMDEASGAAPASDDSLSFDVHPNQHGGVFTIRGRY